ncbi:MAG: serine hydrolase [Candidatus Uhrbacteria bacterium]
MTLATLLFTTLTIAFHAWSASPVPTIARPLTGDGVVVAAATPIPQKIGAELGTVEELGPILTAESATVLDVDSGALLYGKRPYAVRPLASITKLLTALTFSADSPDWFSEVIIDASDLPSEGNTIFRADDVVRVDDLFTAMLVRSDNGAARALARVAGQEAFIARMQQQARRIGIFSLTVAEPSGLAATNRGTAVDVARLLRAALDREEIRDRLLLPETAIRVQRVSGETVAVRTTNVLLLDGERHAFTIVGGKTGYIDESGYNFVLEAERDGHRIVVVVLGSATHMDRFQDARVLADWTFRNYRWVE